MEDFWGMALWKQSVWRGDGGMEPDPATCPVLQGQGDASPSSEQRPGANPSTGICTLSPQGLAPRCPSALSPQGSIGSWKDHLVGENSQVVFWDPSSPTAILKHWSTRLAGYMAGSSGSNLPHPLLLLPPLPRPPQGSLLLYHLPRRNNPANLYWESGRGPG